LVREVMDNKVRNGFAIVRPPGHHAGPTHPGGFCLFNNVAIAAKYVQNTYGSKRILIFDWDIHHGNGVQTSFYNDPDVLYISAHRHDNGFYPNDKGDATYVGDSDAKGKNINIPWETRKVGTPEYMHLFFQLVMPVATEFCPDLVLGTVKYIPASELYSG